MKKLEILSWNKNRNECGFRLHLINHEDIFVAEYGTAFHVNEIANKLSINIIEYGKDYDYSNDPATVIGDDKTHVEKCKIIGNMENLREFQKHLGFSSLGKDATEMQRNNDLCATIEDLTHAIRMLEHELTELKNDSIQHERY